MHWLQMVLAGIYSYSCCWCQIQQKYFLNHVFDNCIYVVHVQFETWLHMLLAGITVQFLDGLSPGMVQYRGLASEGRLRHK
jgi:hypothetical protein